VARFLVPVIGSMSRDDALASLTRVATQLSPEEVKRAIANVVHGTVGRSIEPVEFLLTLVNLDTKDQQALVVASDALLEQKSICTERVLARVVEELAEQEVLPVILMRVVIKVRAGAGGRHD
jgi:hypothetical protein